MYVLPVLHDLAVLWRATFDRGSIRAIYGLLYDTNHVVVVVGLYSLSTLF